VRASLLQKDVELEERDFFKDAFTEDELRGLLGDASPSEIFSWRSPSFNKLGLARECLSDGDLIRLMVEEPRLIRRPLIHLGDRLIVGTDKEQMSDLIQ
jgi:arsenate reductase-like glutaredoxin family protein